MSWLTHLLHPKDDRVKVLAVIADTLDRVILDGIADRARWDLKFAANCDTAVALLAHHRAAVIVCDREQPGRDWREALAVLTGYAPVVVSAPATDDLFWLEVIERGGYDVVTRPFHENRLVVTVLRAACQGNPRDAA